MVYQKDSRQDTLIKAKGQFLDESEQTVIASIKTMGANIEHSAKNNHRPYLMLYGEISAVAFPNGNYQTFYPPTQTHIRYEFSDSELSQLASKGLFYDGFKCPDIITSNDNIEIPMTATARRYLIMDNIYVTLDLASADIYKTDTKTCGYVLADYFDTQIPTELNTEVTQPQDVIPTFDDDFAAQFNAEMQEMKDAGLDEPTEQSELNAANSEKTVASINAEKLLQASPTARQQKAMAEREREVSKAKEHTDDLQRVIEDDNEFAAFRQSPLEFFNSDESDMQPQKSESDIDRQASAEGMTSEEYEAKSIRTRAAMSDASVNISVADNDGDTAEDRGYPKDVFDGVLDDAFYDASSETFIDSIESSLQSETTIKPNTNRQKITVPDKSSENSMNYDIV